MWKKTRNKPKRAETKTNQPTTKNGNKRNETERDKRRKEEQDLLAFKINSLIHIFRSHSQGEANFAPERESRQGVSCREAKQYIQLNQGQSLIYSKDCFGHISESLATVT